MMDNHGQRQQAEQQQAQEQNANLDTGSQDSSGDIEMGQPMNERSATEDSFRRLLEPMKKRDLDMLKILLSSNPQWKDLRDRGGRTPLHYAASLGYYEGVCYLLGKCACTIERDNDDYHPLHLASDKGHVRVVRELVKYSSEHAEAVDRYGRNILHITAENGRYKLVKYIPKTPKFEKMINSQDVNGNTPLHLASFQYYSRIVHALTWNKTVDLTLLNTNGQTALDVVEEKAALEGNLPLSLRLAWVALKSAGAPRSSIKTSAPSTPASTEKIASNQEQKDKPDSFITVVSTLIITVTFATGFTLPGGNSGSDSNPGIANMINHSMFYLFIFSNTRSMYSALMVTIINIWTKLGDLTLTLHVLKLATPLLLVSLGSLSLSFLAGVYLVISKLNWLAITFLVISSVSILIVVLLYAILFLPSTSRNPVMRYISYFPLMLWARLVEPEREAS